MTVIATVCKSGGEYNQWHVHRLMEQVKRHCDLEFVCLTDLSPETFKCKTIPLKHSWHGWWSKINLFEPDLFNDGVIYLDLDMTVVGDVSLLARKPFTMCRDFIRKEQVNSSVMSWIDRPTGPYELFKLNVAGYQQRYRRWPKIGDQAFVEDNCAEPIMRFDDNLVSSFRIDCKNGIPDGTVAIAFHGKPKPWDLDKEIFDV